MVHGFLNIDKPAGITSHDVVARVRRYAGQRRVGHAGTLDPAATGVLIVALGLATRLIEYVQDETTKRYHAVVRLGVATTTDDAEGEPIATHPVPVLDQAELERTLMQFRGRIAQVPPRFSALHHQGRRLYDLARAGVAAEVSARSVEIEQLTLLAWEPPLLTLDVVCSKGTYIRSLARDIGAALGCGGHLYNLRRTAIGAFTIAQAVSLDQIAQAPEPGAALAAHLLPPDVAVAGWPALHLNAGEAEQIRNGRALVTPSLQASRARAYGPDGRLLALVERTDQGWHPSKVFHWADA